MSPFPSSSVPPEIITPMALAPGPMYSRPPAKITVPLSKPSMSVNTPPDITWVAAAVPWKPS